MNLQIYLIAHIVNTHFKRCFYLALGDQMMFLFTI